MTLDPKRWEGHARGPFDVIVGDDLSKPITVIDADDNDIADVWSRDGATVFINREQAIATARLFSDAPALATAVVRLTAALTECIATIEEDRDSVRDSETVPGHEYDPDDASPICRDLIAGYDAVLARARAALAGGAE